MPAETTTDPTRTPPPIRVADFVRTILEAGLLEAAIAREFRAWFAAGERTTQETVNELIHRRWLTPYQVREIVRGRVAGLAVGPYRLIDVIGEGGMGRVFKAKHVKLDRFVALKILRKDRLEKPQTMSRFRQEVRAAAALSHPNVVLALDAEETDDLHYFAMEYVEGSDLTKCVRDRGPMPMAVACDVIRQTALGLQHAAECGLVHRDVKPSNILLAANGQAKLLDLGLAILVESADSQRTRVTQEGYVLGTPDFVSPEQARNSMTVDARADIYSLAATLYFCLAGRVPYDAASPADKLVAHVTAPPPSVRSVRPELPAELDSLIQWAMAKSPDDRPQTSAEFANALRPFCDPSASFAPPTAPDEAFRLEAPPRVHRPASGIPFTGPILALLASAALGVGGYAIWTTLHPKPIVLGDVYESPVGLAMVKLPAGSYRQGSPPDEPDREEHEGPVRDVTISQPFFAGRTEVTDKQYRSVMGGSPSRTGGKGSVADSQPVNSVTYDEAIEFCRKLTEREKAMLPPGWHYRLPTEAEWEYACRAGTTTAFSFGDHCLSLEQAVVAIGEKPRSAMAVGKTVANPFGLHDLHGNVAEWVLDHYARDRGGDAVTDPTGPPAGDFRVIRGGAWDEPAGRGRSAARERLMPGSRRVNVGFRVVLAPAQPRTAGSR